LEIAQDMPILAKYKRAAINDDYDDVGHDYDVDEGIMIKIILLKHRLTLALKSSLLSQKSFMREHQRSSANFSHLRVSFHSLGQGQANILKLFTDQIVTNSWQRQDHIFLSSPNFLATWFVQLYCFVEAAAHNHLKLKKVSGSHLCAI